MKTLETLFSRYGYPSDECNEQIHLYFTRADKLGSMDNIIDADKRATEKITELLETAELLKKYRQTLFERAQIITAANYRLKLTLTRNIKRYDNKKYYQIEITKVFDRKDIAPKAILSERYAGTERHKAIKRFEELRKLHPGIEAEKDIAKKYWE